MESNSGFNWLISANGSGCCLGSFGGMEALEVTASYTVGALTEFAVPHGQMLAGDIGAVAEAAAAEGPPEPEPEEAFPIPSDAAHVEDVGASVDRGCWRGRRRG